MEELEWEFQSRGRALAVAHSIWERASREMEANPCAETIAAALPPMRETSDAAIAFGAALRRFVDFVQPLSENGQLWGDADIESDDPDDEDDDEEPYDK